MKAGARYLRPDRRGDKFPPVETELNHCLTPRCRGLVHKKRMHSPYCAACRMSRWKESHPIECAFHALRGHAKERGKEFLLTLEQFRSLCLNTDYIERKGKESMSLQIDRTNNDEGYIAGNVQVISLRENTLKEFRKQFVPFYKNQMENVSYEPTAEEIAAIQSQL